MFNNDRLRHTKTRRGLYRIPPPLNLRQSLHEPQTDEDKALIIASDQSFLIDFQFARHQAAHECALMERGKVIPGRPHNLLIVVVNFLERGARFQAFAQLSPQMHNPEHTTCSLIPRFNRNFLECSNNFALLSPYYLCRKLEFSRKTEEKRRYLTNETYFTILSCYHTVRESLSRSIDFNAIVQI